MSSRIAIAKADIERARAVPIEDEIARRGIDLRRAGAELVQQHDHHGQRRF
jgi:hypothetical protein